MKIVYYSAHETVIYAAEELSKYLKMMDNTLQIIVENSANKSSDICQLCDEEPIEGKVISLGLLSDFGLYEGDVEDYVIDDVVDISVKDGNGYIAGSNERSILLGVYEYLKSAGCLWPRPGEDGEYIPQKEMENYSFQYRKKADYPFRGECIEGAVSFEHVRDTIIWAPKVGMNLFMMEQVIPYNYISRWYTHAVNTVKEDEKVTFEEVGEMVLKLEKQIKKCGLQLHALGHGYLLEPYGIHYKTWNTKYELTEEAKADVALVDGKRELFHGSPNFTQLCYSKERVRLGLVRYLVEYLERKPYIDFLHVWLADAANNQCECEDCIKKRPSDFYVQLLNELDAELSSKGIDTKLVFIMYTDTLWAPELEKINNPSRFVMTTATVRDYSVPYEDKRYHEEIPSYKRNDFNVKTSFPLTLSFMDAWEPFFDGKKFIFEYYMYTAHYFDPGYFQIAQVMLADVKQLDTLGFAGIMSDQTQRSFLPNGLPNAVLGEGLVNKSLDFESYAEKYFKAAYGADWQKCYDYLKELTELFSPAEISGKESVMLQDTGTGNEEEVKVSWKNNPVVVEKLRKIRPFIEHFTSVIESNLNSENKCHAKSWYLLKLHAELCIRTAGIYITYAEEGTEKAREMLKETVHWISCIEDEIAPQFDLVLYEQRMRQTIKK